VIRVGERYHVPKGVSAVGVILAMAGIFAALGYVLSGPAQTLAADTPRIATEVQDKLGGLLERVASLRERANEVTGAAVPSPTMIDTNGDGVASTAVVVAVEDPAPGLADQVVAGLASAGGAVGGALILTSLPSGLGRLLPPPHRRGRAPPARQEAGADHHPRRGAADLALPGAIFVINLGLGVIVGTVLWLLGMPMAVVWGILAFLLNFIPFVGNILTVVLVGAVALVTYDTLGRRCSRRSPWC
jgi:predicted PurR-regulated permease PerM